MTKSKKELKTKIKPKIKANKSNVNKPIKTKQNKKQNMNIDQNNKKIKSKKFFQTFQTLIKSMRII